MALNADDRSLIQAIWPCVADHSEQYGGEALYRMLLCYPATKVYFPNFDFSPNSAKIKAQGKKIVDALTECVKHLDCLDKTLSHLSDLHAYDLRVDPGNFPLLAHNILVVIAIHHPNKFDCLTHEALDKFLSCVSSVLISKYR